MIRLLINGQEVALPDDFSFTLYEENPVYTKNGKYTYDLTLSLNNFRNARIYENINRVNIKNGIQPGRSAILIVDNRVALNGTEIILGFGDSNVKIQLASGKSEFNFLMGSDKNIRDLNLGKAIIEKGNNVYETGAMIIEDLQHTYPEREWLLLPYATADFEYVESENIVPERPLLGNYYMTIWGIFPHESGPRYDPLYTGSFSGYVPQPYFCFIINRIIESLGYAVIYNALAEHSVWKYAYIVHGIHTFEFAKMLPEWSVDEFFSKIELQFDCTFIVNDNDKTVKLLFNYQAEEEDVEKQTITIKDEFDVEEDEENRLNVRNSNIGYSLDSDEYYSYMNLNNSIRETVRRNLGYVSFEDNLSELFERIKIGDWKKNIIKETTDTITQFVKYNSGITDPTIRVVDSFRPLLNNPNSTELDHEFDIIPAAMIYFEQWAERDFGNNKFWIQVPVAGSYDSLYKDHNAEPIDPDENINVQELIEGDSSVSKSVVPSKIRLALYDGLKKLNVKQGSTTLTCFYPLSYVEYLDETLPDSKNIRYFGEKDKDPFRLNNMYEEIYKKAESIDTTEPYKFSFELKNDFNIRSIFIIRNREFVCSKIEKTITLEGFSKYALGYFYPRKK